MLDDFNIDDFEFEFDDTEQSSSSEVRYKKPRRSPTKTAKYRYAVEASKQLSKSILNKEQILILLDGSFIFGDFIEAFLVENNLLCKNLTISTLGISKENVDSLHNLIEGGYVENLTLHVSDFYYAHNRGNIKYVYEQLDADNSFQLVVSSNHTKVVLIELENQKIVMHGSANLRSSDCIEQMTINSDKESYDFFNEVFEEIADKYATINKSVRSKELSKVFKE